ncbi:MAG: hypothetical protein H3Z52_12765 [archaeon]|nr:hypothetical protein [archaeon]
MKSFSQRKGLKPIKNKLQVDSMDSALRNRLWNALQLFYWSIHPDLFDTREEPFFIKLWDEYFKNPLSTLDEKWFLACDDIRKYFFGCVWNEVYDFIEFIANSYSNKTINQKFMEYCNSILESEVSAYRFVNGTITQITSKEEISEIEEALETPLTPVKAHLKRALDLLSDKKSPDYRNSIKESISAVESICELITKKETTLGQCLGVIEKTIGPVHGALKGAFEKLYGYTSTAEGIRHALLDEPKLSFEDAKFMLVSCSAFINYLISKASKAGIQIQQ